MDGIIPQSTVPRPPVEESDKIKGRSHTSDDATESRIQALAKKYGHTRASFIQKILVIGMDAVEANPMLLIGGNAASASLESKEERP